MMGEPAYMLIVHSSDPTKGKGDEYGVEVYISGVGDVEVAKLYVSIPAYIPETIEMDPDGRRLTVKARILKQEDLHPNSFDLTIPNYLFNRKFFNSDPNDLGVEGERVTWDDRSWEKLHYSPLYFIFTIANDAPCGDHNIYLHLVYKSCLRWYSNSATVKIHIKRWYEQELIQLFVIIAALASIISGCYALYNIFLRP